MQNCPSDGRIVEWAPKPIEAKTGGAGLIGGARGDIRRSAQQAQQGQQGQQGQHVGCRIFPPVDLARRHGIGLGAFIRNDVPLDAVEMRDLWTGRPGGDWAWLRLVRRVALKYCEGADDPVRCVPFERAGADHFGHLRKRVRLGEPFGHRRIEIAAGLAQCVRQ
jgi:hypothetical protein